MRRNRSENNKWSLERAESSWIFHSTPDFSSDEGALTDLKDGIGYLEDKKEREKF